MAKSRSIRKPEPTTDRRTPEERLEAFVREKYADRAQRMWARILDGLDAVPEPAPWISAARTLSERLIISEDAFYWFAEKLTECLVFHGSKHDPELLRIYDEIDQIKRDHGLGEDEDWLVGEGPEEWTALNERWNARADEIVDAALRAAGSADVADLRKNDPNRYDERVDKGRLELWNDASDEELPID
jgi:hypothetical protein